MSNFTEKTIGKGLQSSITATCTTCGWESEAHYAHNDLQLSNLRGERYAHGRKCEEKQRSAQKATITPPVVNLNTNRIIKEQVGAYTLETQDLIWAIADEEELADAMCENYAEYQLYYMKFIRKWSA